MVLLRKSGDQANCLIFLNVLVRRIIVYTACNPLNILWAPFFPKGPPHFLDYYKLDWRKSETMKIRQLPDRSGCCLIKIRQWPDRSACCLIKIWQLPNQSGHCLIKIRQPPDPSGSHHGKIRQLPDWPGSCQIEIRQLPDGSGPGFMRSLVITISMTITSTSLY